ncbi:MAG TPA: PspC domain-containing protein [Propionicimonas sp.]|jgi:phage shock protein C|nr:PspC domain-containing protein [Propionicimonas sp.]
MKEPLTRSTSDKMIAGVCGGLARSLGWDPTLVRVLWVVTSLLIGLPVIAYIVMWLAVPEDQA